MRRFFLVVGFLVSWVWGAENWNGFLDTAIISGWNGTELAFSKGFELGRYEDIAVVVKCQDTSAAGYASDSVKAEYGYQLGYLVLDTGGARDTVWWPPDTGIVLDTMDVLDSAGTSRRGYSLADGTVTDYLGDVDTARVSGYAVQVSWFVPKWAPVIRYFVRGLTGNSIVTPNVWIFDQKRRLHMKVHD